MNAKPQRLNLYWVVTPGNEEDWFVVATTEFQARRFTVENLGYDSVKAVRAEWIMETPAIEDAPRQPDTHILEALGFTVIRSEPPSVVKLGDRVFTEGMLEYTIRQGQKPGVLGDMIRANVEADLLGKPLPYPEILKGRKN